jgi:hypothetical protein
MKVLIMTFAALMVAFTAYGAYGRDKGAEDDLKAAREGAKRDAEEMAKLEASNPQMYWTWYGRGVVAGSNRVDSCDAVLLGHSLFGSSFNYALKACEAEANTMSAGVRRAGCLPTSITLKMVKTQDKVCNASTGQINSPACKDAEKVIMDILEPEVRAALKEHKICD